MLTVQKMRMFWARERRGNSGCNGCGVRCISYDEVLTRERQEECSRNASVFSGCLFHVSAKTASHVRVLVKFLQLLWASVAVCCELCAVGLLLSIPDR